jgi:hypothetical protein
VQRKLPLELKISGYVFLQFGLGGEKTLTPKGIAFVSLLLMAAGMQVSLESIDHHFSSARSLKESLSAAKILEEEANDIDLWVKVHPTAPRLRIFILFAFPYNLR